LQKVADETQKDLQIIHGEIILESCRRSKA